MCLYTDSDQLIRTAILSGESANDFIDATYEVFNPQTKTLIFRKTLGSGISVDGDEFVTLIDQGDIPKGFSLSQVHHQFRVVSSNNQFIPPIFSQLVNIIEVY